MRFFRTVRSVWLASNKRNTLFAVRYSSGETRKKGKRKTKISSSTEVYGSNGRCVVASMFVVAKIGRAGRALGRSAAA